MYSDRAGTDKNHPGQNLPDKRPPDKTPGQKPPRAIETEFVQGGFYPVFCTRPSKNRVLGPSVTNTLASFLNYFLRHHHCNFHWSGTLSTRLTVFSFFWLGTEVHSILLLPVLVLSLEYGRFCFPLP